MSDAKSDDLKKNNDVLTERLHELKINTQDKNDADAGDAVPDDEDAAEFKLMRDRINAQKKEYEQL